MTSPLPSQQVLRRHLVDSRIAGDVATPRESNIAAMRRLADGDPRTWFGLAPSTAYSFADVLAIMVERVGVDPDPRRDDGADTIDPDRTIERLDAMAARLREAVQRRERVFVATGHPAGVLAIHLRIAAALRRAGCELLTPDVGRRWDYAGGRRQLRYLADVAMLSDHGELNHTHASLPMAELLADGLAPTLVVADHGWAGAAGAAGIDVVCFADCNDPALVVGESQGAISVTVPLDDNVLPHLYDPLADRLVAAITA
ncbi:MAG TPA: phosphatase [Mycobacteriales bacterium]|nr:phosphatase [Mycobacteriales bacterium]